MKRNHLISVFTVLLAVILAACSTKKDGFLNRVYHNTTTHFNGHFNSEESIKKGKVKIKAAYKDDFDNILPIFIYGDEEAAKAAYPEMEKAIEKSEKVINRHTIKDAGEKKKKHPVFNKWIDENYMLIGEAYFYKKNYLKAEELFQFVSRKYKDKNIQATSNTWHARALIEREEYTKALQALNKVEIEGDIDEELKADYFLVFADLYLKQNKLEQAAEKMELAIKNTKHKKDRARPHFILAQIYAQLNKSAEAQKEYDMVILSRPPYELEFYSRINKALAYSRRGGSSVEIKKQLMKMLKDEKNITYRDQIYYALGDISLEEQNRPEAIYYFEESLKANVDNKKQKSKTFLRLADLYFEQQSYENAQMYYDSTFRNILENHKRYGEIKARAESLTELVGYLNLIELNDSLASLCGKSDAEIEKSLRAAVKQKEQEMQDKREADEARAAQQQDQAVQSINGTFWCYNSALRTKGQQNFDKTWGDRPLKDNWRLNSKLNSSFGSPDESQVATIAEIDTTSTSAADDPYRVPTVEELRAQLPCGDESKMTNASASTAEAYYQAGVIYKEKLDDDNNAINIWEELIANMEESDFHPVTMYQLFRTWLSREQIDGYKKNPFCSQCDSQYWGSLIKERYPASEWARLVDNPAYLDIQDLKESQETEAYELTYRLYTDRNYPAAVALCNKVISEEPDNHLLCKYRLLRAVCVGYSDAAYGIKENYQKELNEVVKTCGSSDEGKRANELLRAANGESSTSDMNNSGKPDESTGNDGQINPDPKPTVEYTFDETAEHYFAIVIPIQGSDINKTKSTMSDFNNRMYTSSALKVTNNLLDKNNHIVLVKPFKTIPEGKEYLSVFTSDTDQLKDLNSGGNITFLISKQNYIALFKNKNLEGYLAFYKEHYSAQ